MIKFKRFSQFSSKQKKGDFKRKLLTDDDWFDAETLKDFGFNEDGKSKPVKKEIEPVYTPEQVEKIRSQMK